MYSFGKLLRCNAFLFCVNPPTKKVGAIPEFDPLEVTTCKRRGCLETCKLHNGFSLLTSRSILRLIGSASPPSLSHGQDARLIMQNDCHLYVFEKAMGQIDLCSVVFAEFAVFVVPFRADRSGKA
jgi:hypothetical protein